MQRENHIIYYLRVLGLTDGNVEKKQRNIVQKKCVHSLHTYVCKYVRVKVDRNAEKNQINYYLHVLGRTDGNVEKQQRNILQKKCVEDERLEH